MGKWTPGEKVRKMQDKYVEARVAGNSQEKSKEIAGYSAKQDPNSIEKSAYVRKNIIELAREKGIDDNFLIDKFKETLEECSDVKTAKLKDLNAKSQTLRHLTYLLGHGKQQPTVAVQINNTTGKAASDGPGETGELIAEVRDLVIAIRAEIEDRKSSGLHVRSIEAGSAEASKDMDQSFEIGNDVGSGGGT